MLYTCREYWFNITYRICIHDKMSPSKVILFSRAEKENGMKIKC